MAASCAAPPSGCDTRDLADPAAAAAMCTSYLAAACDALIRCKIKADKDACIAELSGGTDCSKVLGVGLGYEQCIDDLAKGVCDKLLPTSCSGVFFATG